MLPCINKQRNASEVLSCIRFADDKQSWWNIRSAITLAVRIKRLLDDLRVTADK
ncbi:hypothetical protein Tco_0959442, partial [Tanacetum coccineum]